MQDWYQSHPLYPRIMGDREYVSYCGNIEQMIRSNEMAAKKPGVNPFAKGKAPAMKGKPKMCKDCGKPKGVGKGTCKC